MNQRRRLLRGRNAYRYRYATATQCRRWRVEAAARIGRQAGAAECQLPAQPSLCAHIQRVSRRLSCVHGYTGRVRIDYDRTSDPAEIHYLRAGSAIVVDGERSGTTSSRRGLESDGD